MVTSTKTTVTTAAGEVKAFEDGLSKFVVTHPKTASFISFGVGIVLTWFVRGWVH